MVNLDALEAVFEEFANFGVRRGSNRSVASTVSFTESEIDATRLVKLAKDCNILDRKLNRNHVDLIFHKVKSRSTKIGHHNRRKLNFEDFVECTKLWARHKGVTHSDLVKKIIASKGKPQLSGTVPDAVAFHDDKSKYTGVYKHGGPESVAKGGSIDGLAGILRPNKATERPVSRCQRQDSEKSFLETKISPLHQPERRRSYKISIEEKSGNNEKNHQKMPKVRKEGRDFMIHPDWDKKFNSDHASDYDKYYYVNRITNEKTWSCPIVPINPPA